MNLKNIFAVVIIAVQFCSFSVSADDVIPPNVVLKNTLENAVSELSARRDEFSKDKNKLHKAIKETLGEVINFPLISKAVLGVHWRKASEQQRLDFIEEFQSLIIGTYAAAVFDYDGESFKFLPFSNPADKDRVKVKTELVSKDGSKLPIIFSMNIRGDTQWKVYNIKISAPEATIEFIPLYRSDFRDRVSSQGLDALIQEMHDKNKG